MITALKLVEGEKLEDCYADFSVGAEGAERIATEEEKAHVKMRTDCLAAKVAHENNICYEPWEIQNCFSKFPLEFKFDLQNANSHESKNTKVSEPE